MNTPSPNHQSDSHHFPHPVHRDIFEALWTETQRLGRTPKWKTLLLDDRHEGFPNEVMRLTLIRLEQKTGGKGSLNPASAAQRACLIQQGIRLLRYWFKRLGNQEYFDWYRHQNRDAYSLDEIIEKGKSPETHLYHGIGRHEPQELLADPLIGATFCRLTGRDGSARRARLTDGEALAVILEWTSDQDQREIYETLTRMGYRFASFTAMRRWLARKNRELKPEMRAFLTEESPDNLPDLHCRKSRPSVEGLDFFVYAGHVPVLGGASPLRGREPPPLSEGKGVSVRRGLKEAGATAAT
jgi:hypothetical protein